MTQRPIIGAALIFLILLWTGSAYPLAPADPGPSSTALGGLVRDAAGKVVEQALVLLSPIGGGGEVRTAITDAEGRYRFGDLPEGLYKLTAIREGYESSVNRVSTWVQARLDVVLAPSAEPQPRPAGSGWVLSSPRRDILRELDPEPAVESPRSGGGDDPVMPAGPVPGAGGELPRAVTSGASAALASIQGEVRQSFSEAGPWLSQSSGPAIGTGSSTSLLLGTPIGDRGRWDLSGEKASENLTLSRALAEQRQSNAERVRVNVQVDTGDAGQLDMRAYYDHDAMLYQSAAGIAPGWGELGTEKRAWGYDAAWNGRVWDDGSLDVDVRYLSSEVGATWPVDDRRSSSARVERLGESGAQANLVRTSARISKGFGAHQMHVGVKAGLYTSDARKNLVIAPSPIQDPEMYSGIGLNGWTVSVSAAESWTLAEPISLDYGLDVSRIAYVAGSLREAVVPQVGVTLRPGKATTVRGVVSYVAMMRDVPGSGGRVAPVSVTDYDPIGYRLQIDHRIAQKMLVALEAESRPFFYDSIGARWNDAVLGGIDGPLYVSDGGASVRDLTLSLQGRVGPWANWTVGATAGQVRGLVAASIPDHDFLMVAKPDSEIRYRTAHFGGRVVKSGTELQVDLSRLDQAPGDSQEGLDYSDVRSMFRVLQDLAFLHPGDTDWTLLLSYSSYRPTTGTTLDQGSGGLLISRASVNRLSGGVSVRF